MVGAALGAYIATRNVDVVTWSRVGQYAVIAATSLAVLGGTIMVYVCNPKDNPRLCNVIQWTVQAVGLLLLAVSTSDCLKLRANVALVVVVVTAQLWLPLVRRLLHCRCCTRRHGSMSEARRCGQGAGLCIAM